MKYVDSTLGAGEEIIDRTHLHEIVFLPAAVLFLLALVLLGSAGPPTTGGSMLVEKAGQFLLLVAVLAFVRTLIEYVTTEYTLTNQRIVTKSGWIARYTTETLLGRVEGIHLRQNVPGRVLDYATVIVTGTGEQRNLFSMAARPVRFMQSVQRQVERIRAAGRNGG